MVYDYPIAHIRFIKIPTWLWDLNDKHNCQDPFVLISNSHESLEHEETRNKYRARTQVSPECLGVVVEFLYIDSGTIELLWRVASFVLFCLCVVLSSFFFIWSVSLVLLGCFPVRNNWFHRQFSNFLQAKSKENVNPFMIFLKDATLIPFSDKPLWFKPWKRFLKAYNRASFGNFTVSLEEK